ncbi:MAG: MMPL family transporter [Bacteroidota bacterium]
MKEKKLRKIAFTVIGSIAALTVFFCFQITDKLTTNYDFEKFFPQNDPETDFFLEFRDKFETDNDFVLIGIGNDNGIFDAEFLFDIDRFSNALARLKFVTDVKSPTNIELPIISGGVPYDVPILNFQKEEKYSSDSTKIFNSPELLNNFFSEDGKHLSILVSHEQYLSKQRCDSLSMSLQDCVSDFGFDEIHLAGRAVGQRYFVERIEMELITFVSISIVLITLFLVIAFRSKWGVAVPLTVVLLAVIWLVGIMVMFGKAFDILLTIVPTILFVVGMSDVVHIVSKYFDELRLGREKLVALKTAFKEIGIATFLTSITTAIGFLTLLSSSIIPLREFGIIAATGVFVAYILAYTLLPAVLLLSKKPKVSDKKPLEVFWTRKLHGFLLWTIRNKKKVLIGSLGVLALCILGISKIEVNNYLLEDLRENDPLKKDFMYFENTFAGVRPFEMHINVIDKNKSIFHPQVLHEIELIEDYLYSDYEIGFIASPVSAIKMINKANHRGIQEFYKLPDDYEQLDKVSKQLSRFAKSKQMRALITEDQSEGRLFGKMGDWGAKEIKRRNEGLDNFINQNINTQLIQVRQTGTARLIDLNNELLSATMIQGLVIAFLAIALIVGLMFKSFKMILISFVPNVFPLLLVAAFMGFTGIDLKVSTAIIFTIAFGIAVDDTIHFLSKLRLELGKGRSELYAIKRTFIGTGKAIILTSLILVAGFLSLMISSFKGTFYTGLLVSLTLFFAVFSDLLLLPVLLWLTKKKSR